MLKVLFLTTILIATFVFGNAQSKVDSTGVHLQKLAAKIQEDSTDIERYVADSLFTIQLVQILKQPFSFQYHFDSLLAIKHLVAPDSAFKIFSWQLNIGEGNYKQRAAIQMNTKDGILKLLPFFDKSDWYEEPANEQMSRKNWMGAIYYDIVLTQFNGTNYYTLLGFDEYNTSISKKIIEVIHFENNEPVIGGNYFVFPNDVTYPKAPVERFVYAYKKGSNGYIRYDKENQRIVLSELTSISNDLKDKSTLVPSGNEVYFIWYHGKWVMPN
jgi:acyl carrier protein